MQFFKALFSFVLAFATASSVLASTIPVARGDYGHGDYPPPSPQPTSSCGGANTFCCNTLTNSANPALGNFGVLNGILNGGLIQGLSCLTVLGGGTW